MGGRSQERSQRPRSQRCDLGRSQRPTAWPVKVLTFVSSVYVKKFIYTITPKVYLSKVNNTKLTHVISVSLLVACHLHVAVYGVSVVKVRYINKYFNFIYIYFEMIQRLKYILQWSLTSVPSDYVQKCIYLITGDSFHQIK